MDEITVFTMWDDYIYVGGMTPVCQRHAEPDDLSYQDTGLKVISNNKAWFMPK
jgi:hypothetical protein